MNKISIPLLVFALAFIPLSAQATKGKKLRHEEAKKECLKDKPALKGKELRKCIKLKRK